MKIFFSGKNIENSLHGYFYALFYTINRLILILFVLVLMVKQNIEVKRCILLLAQKYRTTWIKEYMDEILFSELHVVRNKLMQWDSAEKMPFVHLADQFELAKSLKFLLGKIQNINVMLNYEYFHELTQDTVNKIILKRLAAYRETDDCFAAHVALDEILGSYCQYGQPKKNDLTYNYYEKHGEVQNKIDRFIKTKDTDVLIKVGEKNLYLHSAILCHNSPVFQKMLEGNFKEAITKEIDLSSKQAIAVSEMFKLCYADRKKFVTGKCDFKIPA